MDSKQLLIVSHFYPNGTLEDFLHPSSNSRSSNEMETRNPRMNEKFVLDTAKGIATGMAFIHGKNYIHRDLKSNNILVSEERLLFALTCFVL